MAKKSWRAKMENSRSACIETPPQSWIDKHGGDKMLIASPVLVDAKFRGIPKGKLASNSLLRQWLATDHEADFTCPLTTGIFARIAAEAAEEARSEGRMEAVSPWWRLVTDEGGLNPKFPGGGALQAQLLEQEGFVLMQKGKSKLVVRDFEKSLATLFL